MQEFEQIMALVFGTMSGFLLLACIILMYQLFRNFKAGHLITSASLYRIFVVVFRSISLIVFLSGIVLYVFVLMRGSLFAPESFKATVLLSAFLLMILIVISTVYTKQTITVLNAILSSVTSLILLIIGFMLIYNYNQAIAYPDEQDSVILNLPFDGEWVAIGSGATGLTNHHNRISSQKYAADLTRVGENGKLFTEDGSLSIHSKSWDAEILSPVDGVVETAVDGYLDDRSKRALAGNHVAIKMADSVYVMMAHFKLGSLMVQQGDSVKVGDPIARAGNSGNSDFPHLHIHVQTSPEYDIEETQTLPYRFKEGKVKRFLFWREKENFYLLGNDRVRRD